MKWSTAWGLIWFSCALAIAVGIYTTKSASPLWAFFIPLFITFKSSED